MIPPSVPDPLVGRRGLHGGRQMEATAARHAQVEWVACGHIHRPIQVAWGGTIACTAPSTSHAQVALTLAETSGFDFGYAQSHGPSSSICGFGVRPPFPHQLCVGRVRDLSVQQRVASAGGVSTPLRGAVSHEFDAASPAPRLRHPPPGMVAEWLPSRTRHWSRRHSRRSCLAPAIGRGPPPAIGRPLP